MTARHLSVCCARVAARDRVGPRHMSALLFSTLALLMGLVPCPFCWRTDWGWWGHRTPRIRAGKALGFQ